MVERELAGRPSAELIYAGEGLWTPELLIRPRDGKRDLPPAKAEVPVPAFPLGSRQSTFGYQLSAVGKTGLAPQRERRCLSQFFART